MRGRRPTLAGLHMGTHNLAIIPRLGRNRREYQENIPPPGLKRPRENRKRNGSVLAGLKTRSPGLKRLRKNSLDDGHGVSRAVTNHGYERFSRCVITGNEPQIGPRPYGPRSDWRSIFEFPHRLLSC
jgi:hypothetical protein